MKKLTIILLFPVYLFGQTPKGYEQIKNEYPIYCILPFLNADKSGWRDEFVKDPVGYYKRIFISSDSLYLSTDKPSSTWEDNPATLGMEYTIAKRGTIRAVKFYKATASTKPYTVTVWDSTGGVWFTQSITTSAIGWQRIPCGLLAEPGMKYIIGVYNNDTRYGYKNGVLPRTRGAITATRGRFGYGTGLPVGSGSCYYLDVVFQADAEPAPVASVSPDSAVYQYGVDSIVIKGTVQNAVSWSWEVVDSSGTSLVSGLQGLSPVIRPRDQEGCWVLLMLTARGADGTESAAMADISVMPDPNEAVGIITRSGRIIWLKQIVVTKPFSVGP